VWFLKFIGDKGSGRSQGKGPGLSGDIGTKAKTGPYSPSASRL